jgi:hypothetical protein
MRRGLMIGWLIRHWIEPPIPLLDPRASDQRAFSEAKCQPESVRSMSASRAGAGPTPGNNCSSLLGSNIRQFMAHLHIGREVSIRTLWKQEHRFALIPHEAQDSRNSTNFAR